MYAAVEIWRERDKDKKKSAQLGMDLENVTVPHVVNLDFSISVCSIETLQNEPRRMITSANSYNYIKKKLHRIYGIFSMRLNLN